MKRTNTVRLLIMLILVCALGFVLASCGGSNDPYVTGVSFDDATFTYDGTERTLTVTGELPEGVSVTYEGNTGTDAGTYHAKATLSGEGYSDTVLEATLTIGKAEMSGVGIANRTVTYTGQPFGLTVVGAIPEGAEITYTGAGQVNVGTYQVSATVSCKNYNDLTLTGTLVIEKAEITGITFEGATFTYDGTEKEIVITDALPEGVSVAYEGNKATNTGSHVATAVLSGDNYVSSTLYATLVINPATITGVTFDDASFVWDGEQKTVAVAGLPAGATVTYSENGFVNVGTYPVSATVNLANHTPLVLTATVTVTPATITGVTMTDAAFTYDGEEKELTVSGLPAGATVVFSQTGITDAGIYPVTATVSLPNHNNLTLSAVLTVRAAEISGITFDDATFTYDGTEKEIEISGIENLPEGASVIYENNKATAVGTYVAKVKITAPNYAEYTASAVLIIAKPDDVEIEGVTFEGATFTYDGTEKEIKISGTLPEGVTVQYTDNKGTNAGTYNAVAILSGEGYVTKTLRATLTVEKADIDLSEVTFEGATFTYDGTEKKIEITGIENLPEGVTVQYASNKGTNADTYYAVATFKGDNYNEATLTATLVIEKAYISGVSFAGATFTYDGTEKEIKISGEENLPEGASVIYEGNKATEVGSYVVKVKITAPNYHDLTFSVTMTIEAAEEPDEEITGVTFEDLTVTYNGTEYEIKITGEENLPEGVTVQYTNNKGTNADTYNAVAILSGEGYVTKTLRATLTIEKADIDLSEIAFEGATFTYDGTEKKIEISGIENLPEGVTVQYTNNKGTNADTYNATVTFKSNNYNEATLTATLVIEKATFTDISFDNATFTYDGNEKELTLTGIENLPEGATVQYTDNKATEIGNYVAKVKVSAPNYNDFTASASLIINAEVVPDKEITGVTFEGATFTYDGTEKEIKISGTLPEGVTVQYTDSKGTDVGVYNAVAILSGEGYVTKTLRATLTIEKADIDLSEVTFEDLTVTYDGTEKEIKITGEENLPEGVTVQYTNNKGTNADTYNATVTIKGNNYNDATLTATLVIEKATFTGITFTGATYTYDGTEKSIVISGQLPAGSTIAYSGETDTDFGNVAIGAGEYAVVVVITNPNYETFTAGARLTVEKASLEGVVTLDNINYEYNGEVHTVAYGDLKGTDSIVGTVNVRFFNNTRTEIGSQKVTVVITSDNYETLTLEATITVKAKSSGDNTGITTPPHIFGK